MAKNTNVITVLWLFDHVFLAGFHNNPFHLCKNNTNVNRKMCIKSMAGLLLILNDWCRGRRGRPSAELGRGWLVSC